MLQLAFGVLSKIANDHASRDGGEEEEDCIDNFSHFLRIRADTNAILRVSTSYKTRQTILHVLKAKRFSKKGFRLFTCSRAGKKRKISLMILSMKD